MLFISFGAIRGLLSVFLLAGQFVIQPIQTPNDLGFQKGMAFPTWVADQYCLPYSDESLKVMAQTTCSEWVQLVPTWYQEHRYSNKMFPDYEGNTAREECVRHAIRAAHSLGLKVMLKPHVDSFSGDWRGTFLPENPELWFENYREMMSMYAGIAQQEGVEILSVGCEFVELTTPSFTAHWKDLILLIRENYKGLLIYASNWEPEYEYVEFWDDLDFIGIDGYFNLTTEPNPTIHELMSAWTPYLSELEAFYEKKKKPIILAEIGYRSIDGTNSKPWDWMTPGTIDLIEQALCYQAAISVMKNKPWIGGVYWWNWEPDTSLGGTADKGYTPHGKPAETVLRRWYCDESVQKKGRSRR
jgi:hypothetical protein